MTANPLLTYLRANSITQAAFCESHGFREGSVSKWCRVGIHALADILRVEAATGGEVTANDWAAFAKSKQEAA